jgi:hypothetical protein
MDRAGDMAEKGKDKVDDTLGRDKKKDRLKRD